MKKYLTTPIFYANSAPHIGHLYTGLICDCWKRTCAAFNSDAFLSSGMDEHGQKVYQSALAKGFESQEYVDSMNKIFVDFFKSYSVKPDYWIRTTDYDHHKVAQIFWEKLEKNGYIYKNRYDGWYSISDENYLDVPVDYESNDPSIVWREEECYYFKLSAFEQPLIDYYTANPEAVYPKTRYNEVMGFLKQGLKDFSISRPKDRLEWGIEVPNDPEQVMYVWIDALVNYLTLIGYPDEKYKTFWPAVHVVGKDILKFHAVYWPALLMAAEVELPKKVVAHGWWLNGDEKISKSKNNAIDIDEMKQAFGADSMRYFLCHHMTLGEDASFVSSHFREVVGNILSNKFGNLFSRLIGLAQNHKYSFLKVYDLDADFEGFISSLIKKAEQFVNDISFLDDFLELFVDSLDYLNNYVNENGIWSKTGEDLEKTLYSLLHCFKVITVVFNGVLPETAKKICDYFEVECLLSAVLKHKDILIKEKLILFPKQ